MVRHIAVYLTVMMNEFPPWFPLKELPPAALKEDRWCFCPAGDPLLHSMMLYKCKQASLWLFCHRCIVRVQLRESHLIHFNKWKSRKCTKIQYGASNSSFRVVSIVCILIQIQICFKPAVWLFSKCKCYFLAGISLRAQLLSGHKQRFSLMWG